MNTKPDRVASVGRRAGTSRSVVARGPSLATCPIRGCKERLGPNGLTERHLAEHYLRDDGDAIVAALLRVWREHAHSLSEEALTRTRAAAGRSQ